jgi:hypothetical protein
LKDFIFHEGDVPSGYTNQIDVSIFNRPDHLRLQSQNKWLSFYILNRESQTVDGIIHFQVQEKFATSPLRSPFGSFEFSKKVDAETVFDFISFVEARLKSLGITQIAIKNPPEAYLAGPATLLPAFLANLGYRISIAEISSIIPVSGMDFEAIIHPDKRRRLRHPSNDAIEFRLLDTTMFGMVYDFISKSRDEKNFKLSMSVEELQRTIEAFPLEFLLFGLFLSDELIGASIAIRINSRVLYHFISDHVRKIGHARPGLVLMKNIYSFCQAEKIQSLDLGTSALEGKPNFNLMNFKSEIGGLPSSKFTFAKQLV